MNSTIRAAAVLIALLGGAVRAGAQEQGMPRGRPRVPVVVAMLDSGLADSSGYRILRRHGGDPGDIITLSPAADASTFSAAVRELMLVRRLTGDTASTAATVRFRDGHGSAKGGGAPLPWAERVLGDLRAAGRSQVPGLGRVRTVRIWLPAHRRGRADTHAPQGGR